MTVLTRACPRDARNSLSSWLCVFSVRPTMSMYAPTKAPIKSPAETEEEGRQLLLELKSRLVAPGMFKSDARPFRLFHFLWILLLNVVFVPIAVYVLSSAEAQFSLDADNLTPITFYSDRCRIRMNNAVLTAGVFAVRVRVPIDPLISVEMDDSQVLRIVNERETDVRYEGYSCVVDFFVPDVVREGAMPSMSFISQFPSQSTIDFSNLPVTFAPGRTFEVIGPTWVIDTNVMSVPNGHVEMAIDNGGVTMTGLSAPSVNIVTEDVDVIITTPDPVDIYYDQPSNRVCFGGDYAYPGSVTGECGLTVAVAIDTTFNTSANATGDAEAAFAEAEAEEEAEEDAEEDDGAVLSCPPSNVTLGDLGFLEVSDQTLTLPAKQVWNVTSQEGQIYVTQTPDGETPSKVQVTGNRDGIGFAQEDLEVLYEAFHPGNDGDDDEEASLDANYFQIFVTGAGAPEGKWAWFRERRSVIFNPVMLEVVSFGFLAPDYLEVNMRLFPGFCPLIVGDDQFSAQLVSLYRLIRRSLGTIPIGTDVAYLPGDAKPARVFERDYETGEFVIQKVAMTDDPALLLTFVLGITIPILFATIIVVGGLYMTSREMKKTREKMVRDSRGQTAENAVAHPAKSGPCAGKLVDQVEAIRTTDIVYFMDAVADVNEDQPDSFFGAFNIVLRNVVLFALVVLPFLIMGVLYHQAAGKWDRVPLGKHEFTETPLFPLVVYGITVFYAITAYGYLCVYYVNPKWGRFRAYYRRFFYTVGSLVLWASAVYTVLLILWICLGVLVKPERNLPKAIGIVGTIAHGVNYYAKLRGVQVKLMNGVKSSFDDLRAQALDKFAEFADDEAIGNPEEEGDMAGEMGEAAGEAAEAAMGMLSNANEGVDMLNDVEAGPSKGAGELQMKHRRLVDKVADGDWEEKLAMLPPDFAKIVMRHAREETFKSLGLTTMRIIQVVIGSLLVLAGIVAFLFLGIGAFSEVNVVQGSVNSALQASAVKSVNKLSGGEVNKEKLMEKVREVSDEVMEAVKATVSKFPMDDLKELRDQYKEVFAAVEEVKVTNEAKAALKVLAKKGGDPMKLAEAQAKLDNAIAVLGDDAMAEIAPPEKVAQAKENGSAATKKLEEVLAMGGGEAGSKAAKMAAQAKAHKKKMDKLAAESEMRRAKFAEANAVRKEKIQERVAVAAAAAGAVLGAAAGAAGAAMDKLKDMNVNMDAAKQKAEEAKALAEAKAKEAKAKAGAMAGAAMGKLSNMAGNVDMGDAKKKAEEAKAAAEAKAKEAREAAEKKAAEAKEAALKAKAEAEKKAAEAKAEAEKKAKEAKAAAEAKAKEAAEAAAKMKEEAEKKAAEAKAKLAGGLGRFGKKKDDKKDDDNDKKDGGDAPKEEKKGVLGRFGRK